MAAAEGVARDLVGEGQQASCGVLPFTGKQTRELLGELQKVALRFWSLFICAVTLVLACPAVLQAQTFQTIAPLSFTKAFAEALSRYRS